LEYLFLHSNQLCGEIPSELKNLSNIRLPDDCYTDSCLKLNNNHLTATDSQLIEWLNTYNPGWQTAQTPCPQQECKLQLSSATYSVNENEEQATITVTRTDSSDGAVSIDYAASDDTATAPDDYTQATGTLNWSDGENADKTFTINITDDSTPENDENFIVSLDNPTGGAILGEPNTAVVTITDNDTTNKHGIVQFTKPTYSIKEDIVNAIIIVERIGGSEGDILVEFTTNDGTAKAGSDYSFTKGSVRWADGDNEDKTLPPVLIYDDEEPEKNETFTVTLHTPRLTTQFRFISYYI
jgi:hypothetical protein